MMNRIERFHLSFTNPVRKADRSDTRQDIHRHDPDLHRKRQERHFDPDADDSGDLNDISVRALIVFLEAMLESGRPEETSNADESEHAALIRPPSDETHARAASAYGRNDAKTPRAQSPSLTPALAVNPAVVRPLIRSLHALEDKGIDHITLERADGFFESIQMAVEKHKAI